MNKRPAIIAHRGFSSRYVENTLPAVRAALRLGVDYVEVDVRESRDGEIVVYHDASLRRLHRLRAPVSRKTLPELKTLDPPVATLGEVLRVCRGKAGVLVEIKRANPIKVAALIRRYRMEQSAIVFAFDARYLHRLAATHPHIRRFGLIGRHLRPALRRLPAVAGVGLSLPACDLAGCGARSAPARLESVCVDGGRAGRDDAVGRVGRGRHHHELPGRGKILSCAPVRTGYSAGMLQIVFSKVSAKELAAMPRQLQLEVVDGFEVLPRDFEQANEKFGLLSRAGKRIYRYRVKDYRIYFEKHDGIINVLCILNKNSMKDFFFRSKLPMSEDQLLQENPKFWQLLESSTKK